MIELTHNKLAEIRCDIEKRKIMPAFDANRDAPLQRIGIINETKRSFTMETVEALINSLEAAEKQAASLKDENEYIRKRFKEADLLFGKNLLVMQAAIIEWRATSDAKNGMAWIFNTLLGPGELPSEDEKNAQAYFDREYAPVDEELMELHRWFWERHKRSELVMPKK